MAAKIPETAPTPRVPTSFQYTPMEALRSTFVGFLQGLFHNAPSGCYHWEEDENDTEITIQDESTVKEEVIAKRPVITIVRGPMQFSTHAIDDLISYDADIDRKTKGVIVSGTMTVNCCSRVSLESEKIAWISMEHMWVLRQVLIESGLYETGRGAQLGSPSPAGSIIADGKGDEYIVTPVMMPVQFIRKSSFMPLNKQVVQDIVNRITANIPRIRSVGPGPMSSHEYPQSLQRCPPGQFYPGATDSFGRTPTPGVDPADRLPKVPHPLNPAVQVVVKQVRPHRPGLRGFLNLGSDAVPIPSACVEESE
jgi:hypothetical protein